MEKTYMDDIDRTIFPYVEYPGYPFRYPTHLPLVIEKKQADLLRRVSAALYAIFAKAVRRFQSQSDEFFDEMEIPKKMRRYLHEGNAMKDLPSWLSRFDYVMDQSGRIQMVEINADTPCAEIEAYYANGVAARYFFKEDPNEGEWDRLRSWMKDIFLRCTGGKSREELLAHPVLFSCFDDYVEDLGTTRFLMQAMQDAIDPSMRDTIVFESFYHLAVMEDGSLALPDGRTVSLSHASDGDPHRRDGGSGCVLSGRAFDGWVQGGKIPYDESAGVAHHAVEGFSGAHLCADGKEPLLLHGEGEGDHPHLPSGELFPA